MKFRQTKLTGVLLIKLEPHLDNRGGFCRTYCSDDFRSAGILESFVQCNISRNIARGTLRGLHYQKTPFDEGKLVRCSRGKIFDVVVDLRAGSSTQFQWQSFVLSEENYLQLYIPPGFAHGFQTLEDNTEVFYQMTDYFQPSASEGISWRDGELRINWPIDNPILSLKDQSHPHLSDLDLPNE